MNFSLPTEHTPGLPAFASLAVAGLFIWLHFMLALAALRDAALLHQYRRRLAFFGPVGWGFVTLLTGLLGLGVYWMIHHSTLQPENQAGTRPGGESTR